MFDFVRRHNRVLQFVLVLLIFPSFVVFGIQGYQSFNEKTQSVAHVDGQAITQIVAIALHLDGLFPDKGFLPAQGLARTRALELLAWMNNTLHATFTHVFMPGKFTSDEAAQAGIKATAQAQYAKLLTRLQEQVDERLSSGQPWLAGDHIGPLDAYVLTLLRWGTIAGINPELYPSMWAFVQRVAAEPAVARVIERERLALNLYKPA